MIIIRSSLISNKREWNNDIIKLVTVVYLEIIVKFYRFLFHKTTGSQWEVTWHASRL